MSLRFKICLTAWIVVIAAAVFTDQASGQELTPSPIPPPAAEAFAEPQAHTQAQSVEEAPQPPTDVIDADAPPAPVETISGALTPSPMDDADWQIDILPALRVREAAAASTTVATEAADQNCEGCGRANANDYARIYQAIPFNRADYNANPNYRHDSTMEILTGNARHQTIVRHSTTRGMRPAVAVPSRGGYSYNPHSYGYLRPSLRLNYYRHFPSLNPYVNIWNLSGAF